MFEFVLGVCVLVLVSVGVLSCVGVCVRVFVCDVVGDCVGVLDSVRVGV